MKPKFSWEPSQGSLLLKVTNGDRETTWRIKKNSGMSDLYTTFQEIAEAIDDTLYVRTPKMQGAKSEHIIVDEIQQFVPMNETVRTVDQEELDALREAASLKALSDKAASVTLTGGNFWGNDDLSSLDLYELGTGEPE